MVFINPLLRGVAQRVADPMGRGVFENIENEETPVRLGGKPFEELTRRKSE